jgi:hypothetical protein
MANQQGNGTAQVGLTASLGKSGRRTWSNENLPAPPLGNPLESPPKGEAAMSSGTGQATFRWVADNGTWHPTTKVLSLQRKSGSRTDDRQSSCRGANPARTGPNEK